MRTQGTALYRSSDDRLIAGVCGGLASYFGADPVIVRVLWALGTALTGLLPGVFAYLLLVVIVPAEDGDAFDEGLLHARSGSPVLAGVVLVLVGVLLLAGNFGLFGWLSWGRLWPLVLVLLGTALLARR